jgi:hypothetical protein
MQQQLLRDCDTLPNTLMNELKRMSFIALQL